MLPVMKSFYGRKVVWSTRLTHVTDSHFLSLQAEFAVSASDT